LKPNVLIDRSNESSITILSVSLLARRSAGAGLLMLALLASARADDGVYSGPQPGEKTTPFKAIELRGESAGKERDIIAENEGAPTVLAFVHGVERSMAPLMTVLDEYGKERKELLKTEFVFLSGDRLSSQQRLPLVAQSLRLQSPISLSVDGAEGPGNYGLNKECLLTVVVARENKVATNFALVQPGMADASKIITAIARVINDTNPPAAEQLRERRGQGGRMEPGKAMERRETTVRSNDNLPGAAPTDEKLLGMLRRFIQKSNDDGTVDKVLIDVEEYIRGNDDLTKQAIGGWTRVLHLKYGTEYAQKAGETWVVKLKK
jgi:hypothetical protein